MEMEDGPAAMADGLRSLTVGLFGDPEVATKLGPVLGKEGTENDFRFWNKKERDVAVTVIAPTVYPEKIVPLLQVALLSDVPVLAATLLDASFAETVLLREAQRKKGVLLLAESERADRVHSLVRDRLPGWISIEGIGDETVRRLRELLLGWDVPRDTTSPCVALLDHAFQVRGAGTVALGFVRRGTLRVHDELRLVPLERPIQVRSIQRLDEDETAAPAGSRVGVALKGVDAKDIERGAVLTSDPAVQSSAHGTIRPFHRMDLSKDPIAVGLRGYHLVAGTYVRPVVLLSVDKAIEVQADRAIPIVPGETGWLTVQRGPGALRVLGYGPLLP